MAKRIACGFGAGMGFIGKTCGAVSGAIMLIGLKYGKVDKDDNAAKDKTYELIQAFSNRFIAINSSVSPPVYSPHNRSVFKLLFLRV